MTADERATADTESAERSALIEPGDAANASLRRQWAAKIRKALASAARRARSLHQHRVQPILIFLGVPSFEQCMIYTLRTLFYLTVILGVEYIAFRLELRSDERQPWAHDMLDLLRYWITGVFETQMDSPEAEASTYAMHMRLAPGMTICEMGAADGTLMAHIGKHVMPGGKLIATAPKRAELAATSRAVKAAGLPGVRTYLATNTEWAPGLPPQTCDAIYSRMVIHMIDIHVVRRYIPQLAAALRPGGRVFMTDHNPIDGGHDGPSRPMEWKFGVWPMMYVLPQNTEVREMTAGGHLRVVEGPFDYHYFMGGYGVVYTSSPTRGAARIHDDDTGNAPASSTSSSARSRPS